MSTSSYSSVTVGRKNTSLPPGLRRYLAKRTRSDTRWDSSYGLVGGIYGVSSLQMIDWFVQFDGNPWEQRRDWTND